jgi:hypothetical protein
VSDPLENHDAELTGTMLVACCVCQKQIGTKPCIQKFDGEVSHGICPNCLAQRRRMILPVLEKSVAGC